MIGPERVNGSNASRRSLPPSSPRLAQWLVKHAVPSDIRDQLPAISVNVSPRPCRRRRLAGQRPVLAQCCFLFNPIWRGAVSRRALWRCDAPRLAHRCDSCPADADSASALSTIAVFGVTVAIALAATMFTIIGEELNPPDLPLPQGERIVALQKWHVAKNQLQPIEVEDLVTWREQLSAVRDLAAFRTVSKNLIVPPAVPEPINVAEMSAAGFEVARISPLIGRVIQPFLLDPITPGVVERSACRRAVIVCLRSARR